MLEMKCLGTVQSIVCITATFTQQIVGQIVLGRVVFGTSLACYLHNYHAKNILDWFSHVFQQKLGANLNTYPIILKLNRNNPRLKCLGSVHHQNLSRPKSPGQNDLLFAQLPW